MGLDGHYYLVIDEGANSTREIVLEDRIVGLGRGEGNDIKLAFPAVSTNHAKLHFMGKNYEIEDLNSTNGTFVNGDRITDRRLLFDGDEIRLGLNIKLIYHGKPNEGIFATNVNTEANMVDALMKTAVEEMPPDHLLAGSPKVSIEVAIAGGDPEIYSLTSEKVGFGRADDNVIVINSPIVSRYHGYFKRSANGEYSLFVLPEAGNPVSVNGEIVSDQTQLQDGAKMRIGGQNPGVMVSLLYTSSEKVNIVPKEIRFEAKTTLQIGRDPANDVVLDLPQVSRFHAQVEKVGQRYKLIDLDSTNGTFINDERVVGEVWFKVDDTIRIGTYRFAVGDSSLVQYDDSMDLRVEAIGLNKWVRPDLNILQHISLVLKPREFVVVVGQSGGGKSTLVDAIAGYRPATHGDVFVNDTNVYESFDSIRNIIGFVPQKDIIHMELTVFEALDFTAQLRLPPDMSREERHKRIIEVLEDLDIAHRRDNQIKALSGGQQKRVSIGVELLTKPGLFFLDEPSSGLDPGTETALMHLMRQMADQGRTIILITHATKNVVLADKVVFLARGGFLVWFGPPDEALEYFDEFRSERDRRTSEMEFDQIYALLEDSGKGSPQEWAHRYRIHSAYQKYISAELEKGQKILVEPANVSSTAVSSVFTNPSLSAESRKGVSAWRQFLVLSKRNLRTLVRDRFSLALMLAAAPMVGLLSVVLSLVLGRKPFDFSEGNPYNVVIVLFMLTIYGVMVGGLAQMREIVKETEIYKRERLVNLKIFPYILSKVWVAGVLALYQAACYTIIQYLAFEMPGGGAEFFLILFTLALTTMAGMMMGLFASALSPNSNAAPLIVIMLMLPQIVLGGALVPLPESISNFTSTKWAYQSLMGITGVGSDVAADACWLIDEEIRVLMTEEEKAANGCNCLGVSALHQESCNYPSLGSFYNHQIDEPLPQDPGEPPLRPPDVNVPPPPEKPEDESDTVAMAAYLESLQAYQLEVEALQAQARVDFAAYEAEIAIYQAEVVVYQEAVITHQAAVASAVQPAEAIMATFVGDQPWSFVDKENPDLFWPFLLKTWGAQLVMIVLLFGGILLLQKRKDVN